MKDHKYKITSAASIQYMGALVSAGTMAGCIFGGTTIHDIAPVHLMIQEAGGTVTDLYGDPIDYSKELKGMIASNGAVHGELIKIMQDVFNI